MEIKNIVTISLLVFIIIVIGVLGAGAFLNQNKANPPTSNSIQTLIPTPTADSGITTTEIAKHNNTNNCWVIISNKAYNVTSYIPLHPGGPDKIIKLCGKDATVAFTTKGGKGSHSQSAQDMLDNYYVGDLALDSAGKIE